MRLAVDEAVFERERVRYSLRFCCEDCSFFLGDERGCAHFWPVDDHRQVRYATGGYRVVVFCKEFELK